jgi:multicomponent K+:H+ antiporter subunit D
MALLGLAFVGCALLVAGLPPLPGFVAKAALLAGVLAPQPGPAAWTLVAALLASGLAGVIALGRAGMGIFWGAERTAPRVLFIEMAPVAALLALCVGLTIGAGPAMRYLRDAAGALHAPSAYIEGVLRP